MAQVVECLPSKCEAHEFKPQYHTHTQYHCDSKLIVGDDNFEHKQQ
jgi:hypothetical protein